MKILPLILLSMSLCAHAVGAETVVAMRTIPSKTVIAPDDIALAPGTVPGTLADANAAIGKETRFAIYAGRPIRTGDLTEPALIERNAHVTLLFESGGLRISAEGRALDRAAIGQSIRVLNIGSRQTVTGTVTATGQVVVYGQVGG